MNEQETEYVNMFVKNGLFYMVYKPIDNLDMEIARQIVRDRVSYKAGMSYPCFFDVRKVKTISKEGRDYMADEGNDLVLASALLVNSPVLRMAANFFIAVNKPKNPTKLFTDESQAESWLKQFKNVEAS